MPKTFKNSIPSNLEFHEYPIEGEDFIALVLQGLTKQQKELSPRFFYDQRGSDLFAEITRLPEYYLTQSEHEILRLNAPAIRDETRDQSIIIEPGSGNNEKISALLHSLPDVRCFMPIEISRDHLWENSLVLAGKFPEVSIVAVASDYMNPDLNVDRLIPGYKNPLVFFPGSSIGNYSNEQAVKVLKQFVNLMQGKGKLLIGVDLKKDLIILENAYNDKEGVTARFNLNALHHIKRELDIDGLNPAEFEHKALYNEERGRVEMYLVSKTRQHFVIDGTHIEFEPGETIHTENSHKFTIPEFQELASQAGLVLQNYWTDAAGLFSVQLYAYKA